MITLTGRFSGEGAGDQAIDGGLRFALPHRHLRRWLRVKRFSVTSRNLFNPEPTATAGAARPRWNEVTHGVTRHLETFWVDVSRSAGFTRRAGIRGW
jgi:hypothetical protein